MGNLFKKLFSFGKKSEAETFQSSVTSESNEIREASSSNKIIKRSEPEISMANELREPSEKCDTPEPDKEFIKVDWIRIEKFAREEPEKAKELIQRVTKSGLNELPRSDYVMAYCLQSYFEFECNENDLPITKKPMDITAALMTRNWLRKYLEDCPEDQKKSVHDYIISMSFALLQMYKSIYATGDGSAEHPFVVVSVPDEYAFMREYLELPKHTSQALLRNNCDMFTLPGTSEKYQCDKIYFEITRVLQKEREMFGQ